MFGCTCANICVSYGNDAVNTEPSTFGSWTFEQDWREQHSTTHYDNLMRWALGLAIAHCHDALCFLSCMDHTM